VSALPKYFRGPPVRR